MRSFRSRWKSYFPVVYLVFLALPMWSLYHQPRSMLEYVFGSAVLIGFVLVFLWAFFWTSWHQAASEHYRIPSLVGMGYAYLSILLLWNLIGDDSLGMLIYAAAFAGVQRSVLPALASTTISLLCSTWFLLQGESVIFALQMAFATVAAAFGTYFSYQQSETGMALRRSQNEVTRIAQIAERERIARDLHDLLGHTLSLIILKSELASKLSEKNPTRATQEINEIERIARESLQEVRQAVRGYRNVGLNGELENVALALRTKGINFEPLLKTVQLEWATEQALTFCLRESITNIVRHSQAKRCWIILEPQADMLHFEIWDDGNGHIQEGNGIRGMRERITQLGGQLEVQSWEGSTGVKIQMPNRPKQEFA